MTKPRAGHRRERRESFEPGEREALIKAILDLPEDPRDVFLLHRMAHMSYDEIADVMGTDRERVQAHFASALVGISQTVRDAED